MVELLKQSHSYYQRKMKDVWLVFSFGTPGNIKGLYEVYKRV